MAETYTALCGWCFKLRGYAGGGPISTTIPGFGGSWIRWIHGGNPVWTLKTYHSLLHIMNRNKDMDVFLILTSLFCGTSLSRRPLQSKYLLATFSTGTRLPESQTSFRPLQHVAYYQTSCSQLRIHTNYNIHDNAVKFCLFWLYLYPEQEYYIQKCKIRQELFIPNTMHEPFPT
jgi:hypothetical protein